MTQHLQAFLDLTVPKIIADIIEAGHLDK